MARQAGGDAAHAHQQPHTAKVEEQKDDPLLENRWEDLLSRERLAGAAAEAPAIKNILSSLLLVFR